MTTLHLGVIDLPYVGEGGTTTGQVAGYLEGKYEIMERFWNLHEQQFADDIAESVAGAIENLMAGGRPTANPLAQAVSDIEQQFKLFIRHEDIVATLGPGEVPTAAALKGVSHRFKKGKRRGRKFEDSFGNKHGLRRPSFVDTGLYSSSFKVWSEGVL